MDTEKMIQQVFDFFNCNPILNIISLLLATLGIIFTIYFYFKSKKNRIPTYVIRTINLVREKIQKIDTVEILYSGEKVKNLSISKIAFWNEGLETINSIDIALNNPIKLKIKDDFEFLEAEILFQKNEANDFKIIVSEDNKCIKIAFDYFDFEEGIVLQVFHTGNSSDDIYIDGKVKSVKKILRREIAGSILPFSFIRWLKNDKDVISKRTMRAIMGWTVLIMGVFVCCLVFVSFSNTTSIQIPKSKEVSNIIKLFTALPGLLYMWLGYRIIKKKIPKGFDIFNEEF